MWFVGSEKPCIYSVPNRKQSYAPYRTEVAAFQKYACQAAEEGDHAAAELYREAARELALMVRAIKKQLRFSTDIVDVSYFGGLFKAGELILKPFREEVEALDCNLKPPCRTATEGALLLAIEYFNA